MFYVYILQSLHSNKIYVGSTVDVVARLKKHNEGGSISTKDYRPWRLVFYCAFNNKTQALAFEKYLKSHSGRAFLQKRLVEVP